PSFISTLAGLLALLGMQLYLLGNSGSINLPYASTLVAFGQLLIMPDWFSHLVAFVPGLILFFTGLSVARRRAESGLSAQPFSLLVIKVTALTAALQLAVWYLNLG